MRPGKPQADDGKQNSGQKQSLIKGLSANHLMRVGAKAGVWVCGRASTGSYQPSSAEQHLPCEPVGGCQGSWVGVPRAHVPGVWLQMTTPGACFPGPSEECTSEYLRARRWSLC